MLGPGTTDDQHPLRLTSHDQVQFADGFGVVVGQRSKHPDGRAPLDAHPGEESDAPAGRGTGTRIAAAAPVIPGPGPGDHREART